MKITDIPEEVYAVAYDYEGFPRPSFGSASQWYAIDRKEQGWTDAALLDALSDFLLGRNAFAQDGEFASVRECTIGGRDIVLPTQCRGIQFKRNEVNFGAFGL
jgi:hypothetical protein